MTSDERPKPFFGQAKIRIPDSLWLTPRCQRIVNEWNAGDIDDDTAVTELQAVGNTVEQARAILDVHRGRPQVKVKAERRDDPLRRAKR